MVAGRGYLGRFKDLYDRGITLIYLIRSNMKNVLMSLFHKFLFLQISIIEIVFGILKSEFNIEDSRHRGINGFFINIFTALASYAFRHKKPFINDK